MICWLDRCKFDDLHSAMVLAVLRAESIYANEGVDDLWITSINDSTHSLESLHYAGRAVDLRTHHLPDEAARERVTTTLRAALGPQFDVIYENAGTPNAHIHVELDGRR